MMSHTRSIAFLFIVLVSSVSGCMSKAQLVQPPDVVGGRPVACRIVIPERTDSWPYYHLRKAKELAKEQLHGEVEEVPADANARLDPNHAAPPMMGNPL